MSEGRRKGPMELRNCGVVPLRPQQSTAERGSPHPYWPPLPCNSPMSSRSPRNRKGLVLEPEAVRLPGLGWESGFPLVKATGREGWGGGTTRAPNVFPNHWKQDAAAGLTPGHNNIPSSDAINGNVFLEGQDLSGVFQK